MLTRNVVYLYFSFNEVKGNDLYSSLGVVWLSPTITWCHPSPLITRLLYCLKSKSQLTYLLFLSCTLCNHERSCDSGLINEKYKYRIFEGQTWCSVIWFLRSCKRLSRLIRHDRAPLRFPERPLLPLLLLRLCLRKYASYLKYSNGPVFHWSSDPFTLPINEQWWALN